MTKTAPIYLNASSLGLPDAACAEVVARQALRPPGNPDEEAELREAARRACSRLLGAEPADVGLGSGTFQLWSAVMGRLPFRRGRILVAAHEWGDNVRWLQRLAANTDVTLDVVPAEGGEAFDPNAWAARIDEDVIALCLPLVTSVGGLRYPARDIAGLARPENALFVLDAAQALGRIAVSPADLGCDVLVGTARKWLRAPRQTAMFWLSGGAKRVLRCAPPDIEPFDLNAALLAGLTYSADAVQTVGMGEISAAIGRHDGMLRAGLEDAPAVRVRLSSTVGTIACSVHLNDRAELKARLRDRGIVAKWCDPVQDEPLANDTHGTASLRFSPHVYNTEEDVRAAFEVLSR